MFMEISIDIESIDRGDDDIVSIEVPIPELVSIGMSDILADAVGTGVLRGS